MLDLGNSFRASVERDPDALAIVDGSVRLTYAQWYRRISALMAGFDELGLMPDDHLVTLLQNRWEAATVHWACQFAGIVITPVNWRAKTDEIDYCLENSEAKVVVFEEVSADALRESREAKARKRIALGTAQGDEIKFDTLLKHDVRDAEPRGGGAAGAGVG
jgi:2-furoate---CoA ligase